MAAEAPAPDVRAAEAAVPELDDTAAAAEDDESDLLHGGSRVAGGVSSGSVDADNSDLTLRQRMRLIAELLGRPLLASAVAVAGNFGITLALFPGVLTEMRSSNKNLDDWFVPRIMHPLPSHQHASSFPAHRIVALASMTRRQVRHTAHRVLQRFRLRRAPPPLCPCARSPPQS